MDDNTGKNENMMEGWLSRSSSNVFAIECGGSTGEKPGKIVGGGLAGMKMEDDVIGDFTLSKVKAEDTTVDCRSTQWKLGHDVTVVCSDLIEVKSEDISDPLSVPSEVNLKDHITPKPEDSCEIEKKHKKDRVGGSSSQMSVRPKQAKSPLSRSEEVDRKDPVMLHDASFGEAPRYQMAKLDRKFICSYCSVEFRHKSKFIIHMRTHTGEKPFSCNSCDYRCVEACKLKGHMRIHTGEKPFSCVSCEYICRTPSNLKRHMATHTGEKPFSCDSCGFRCSRPCDLKRHMRSHTGETPFSCDLCDLRCSRASSLKEHMRIHTGERPFLCDYCHYRCSRAGDLKGHMRTHTGEKPFSCDTCEYSCTLAGNLKRHMRTHTGEKPFSCDFCDYRCSEASKLKLHMRTHSHT